MLSRHRVVIVICLKKKIIVVIPKNWDYVWNQRCMNQYWVSVGKKSIFYLGKKNQTLKGMY